MPRPNTINDRVQSLHRALLRQGWADKRLHRKDAETLLMRRYGLTLNGCRDYIETGDRLGLWTRTDGRGRTAHLIIHRPSTAIQPTAAS